MEETVALSGIEDTKGPPVNWHWNTFTVLKQRTSQTKWIVRPLLIALLILVFSHFSIGQVESGSVAGTVTDQTGAVVVGAIVKVTNLATNAARVTRTSASGGYTVVGLEPETYEIKVSSGDFKPFIATVEVTVGAHVTLVAKLSVGASTTVVQVVAEGAGVNTQTQELSQLVDAHQLAQLPSLTRDPYDFIALSGNVSSADNTTANMNSGQNISNRGVGYSINGQRQSGTEILLDGVENVAVMNYSIGQHIPMDAVQEYSIITNNYAAEYGRASGGVVNVTTTAGTNNIHGSLWEFNRLSAYTANTYANDAANAAAGDIVAPKGRYTRNQFGFQAGGPVLKDKLFLFVSNEWLRVRSSASETEEVLDPVFTAMLPANTQAYFKSFGKGAYAASKTVTTAGQLNAAGYPVGPINGATVIDASTPVFDTVHFKAPFDAGGDSPQNTYRLVGRGDYNLSNRTQMFGRYAIESLGLFAGSSFYSAYPQYNVGSSKLNQSYLYSLSHAFGNSVFGSAKVGFTRFSSISVFDASLINTPSLVFTPPNDPVTGTYLQMPGLVNTGGGSGSLPNKSTQNTIQFSPDLSWNKGKHQMRFGGQLTYIQLNAVYSPYAQAQEQLGWAFQDSMNDLVNAAGNPGGSTLVSFEAGINPQGKLPCVANPGFWASGSISDLNMSAGCALGSSLSAPSYGRSYRYNDWDVYAQDSYKLFPRFTLNYGLRYEHYGVQHNSNASLDSNFYLGSGSSFLERVRNGSVQTASSSRVGGLYSPSWGTIAPRFGFAYDPFGNGKTSVRGGIGISYERDFANISYGAAFTPPGIAVLTSTCAASSSGCSAVVTSNNLGSSQGYLPPVTVQMLDPNIKVAQTQFWSLAVQRQIARNSVIELSYSGAHGVHLYDNAEINMVGAGQYYLGDPLTFSQSPDCASPCLNRPNDQYSVIWKHGSGGTSSYNAFNARLQVQKIRSTGLSLVANYTWSHSLDDISSTASTDSLQGQLIASYGYLNFLNPKLDWGNSDYDVRQRFVVSPMWELPWFKYGGALQRGLLGGWSVSGLFTVRSGTPFSIFDFTNNYNDCTIPRLTPSSPIGSYHVGSPQANGPNDFVAMTVPVPASFAPLDPTLGISDFGPFPNNMTHRNAFIGPGAWNLDMAVSKHIKMTERASLELRAEGFDVFNHHNYYVNTTNLYYDGATETPLQVTEMKGGLGSSARGGNHDERRFGQLAMRVSF